MLYFRELYLRLLTQLQIFLSYIFPATLVAQTFKFSKLR